MSSVEQYAPGAAFGAEVLKDGEKWTLVPAHLLRCAGSPSRSQPIGRIAGTDVMKFGGWQRLNAEYANQFGVEPPAWPTDAPTR